MTNHAIPDAPPLTVPQGDRLPDETGVDRLVRATREGVPGAAEELWSSQARRLVRAAIALGVPVEEAEDVAQEALLSAFRNFGKFDGSRSPFQVWTHRILVGRTSNWHRARRRLHLALSRLAGQGRAVSVLRPDEALAAEEAKRTLHRLTAGLTPIRRRVWVITQISGLPIRAAAETLGLREETVRSHLRHARIALERAGKEEEKP
jgi:RNA polymerase sigma-70 factor (ECF subfamily)